MNRRRLFLEAPVGDYLSDEFKKRTKDASKALYDDPTNPAPSSMAFSQLMMSLPSMERSKKQQLIDLAKSKFFELRPWVKNLVDDGKVRLDVDLGMGSGGRQKSQTPSSSEIERAKQEDPDFEERIQKRNFTNARAQGKAWLDGFGSIKKMESELNSIDPSLYKQYMNFVNGASRFYWENTDMLERMASSGAGRIAYCDVYPDPKNPGMWVFEAKAPNFPLLMHELIKGAEYYESLFSLPKDKSVGDTLMSITDTHKHEIQNMNYGRAIWSKIRYFLEEFVDGYDPSMESDVTYYIEQMEPKEYNRMMQGIINDDNKVIGEFIKFCEEVVNDLNQ